MLKVTIAGSLLVALTVGIHSIGLAALLRYLVRIPMGREKGFWSIAWLLICLTWCLLLLHAVEVSIWALFYRWQDCFSDLETAFYFSGVTYATIGYGEILLPKEWRIIGPLEGLTGILMCGLSTGFFLAAVSRIYSIRRSDGS